MKEKSLQTVLKSLADQAVPPAEVDLMPSLLGRMAPIRQRMGAAVRTGDRQSFLARRAAWLSLVLVALLALIFLLVGPQNALAALRGLFGYLPGVGFVQDVDSLRVMVGPGEQPVLDRQEARPAMETDELVGTRTGPQSTLSSVELTGKKATPGFYQAQPVRQKRGGISLTIEQGVIDMAHTVLVILGDGLPYPRPAGKATASPSEVLVPYLRLPDGSMLREIEGEGNGWETGFRYRAVFPPVPPEVEEVTLVIHRLWDLEPGAGPEDWQIPLRFAPAAPGLDVAPVVSPQAPENAAVTWHGITFTLEKIAQMQDGYLFGGSLSWAGSGLKVEGLETPVLLDRQGMEILTEWVRPDLSSDPEREQRQGWLLRTSGSDFPGPLKVSLPAVGVHAGEIISFTLDLGPYPQVGQSWEINREFKVEGHTVQVVSARVSSHPEGPYLDFLFDGDPDVTCVSIRDAGGGTTGYGKGSCRGAPEGITSAFQYINLPSGVRNFQVAFSYRLPGPWEVTWTLPETDQRPAAPSEATPAAQPEPCLTYDRWRQLEGEESSSFPQDAGGRLLLAGRGSLYLLDLDGGRPRVVGQGQAAALSPDCSRMALILESGLGILDLNTGEETRLAASLEDDGSPSWSPDGNRIAFTRQGDLYLMRSDGFGLRQLTESPENETLTGWTQDGGGLVFEAAGPPEGNTLVRIVDVNTGQETDLLQGEPYRPVQATFAPDGDRIVYQDRAFGQSSASLFLAPVEAGRLIAAERQPLIYLDYVGIWISRPVWSPDGKWLAVTLYETLRDSGIATPILIQAETCRVVRLADLPGEIVSWAPASSP